MTVTEALSYLKEQLKDITDEVANEAKIIVAHLVGTEPSRLPFSCKTVEKEEIDRFISRRRQGTPLQYILGKWWFYKSEFLVGEGVLIPRQDTELLVETALEIIKDVKNPQVCDLCSGSGCIAISIALDRPDSNVVAVEKYDSAYEYLLKNIEHNKVQNVKPVKADVTENSFGKYDIIVSNPPYIPKTDEKDLSREVLSEPHTALFGGQDGLCFYREIAAKWKNCLKENGLLAFEVGIKEADMVADILKSNGFINITLKNDLIGIERVVFGTANNV